MTRTPKEKLKRYSTCVRQWTRSNASFELLDRYVPSASDWGAGGCAPLAMALHRLMPGSTLWAVVSKYRPERPEHVMVKWQGLFWDHRGSRQKRSVQRYWDREALWSPGQAQIVPITDAHRAEMADWGTCAAGLIDEIVRALASCAA